VRLAAGDARSALTALTALETSADGVTDTGGMVIDVPAVERAIAETTVRYDRQGDQHYDVISAFIKSIRGSDPDAALHYLARMLVAGRTRSSSRDGCWCTPVRTSGWPTPQRCRPPSRRRRRSS
jgi:replication-associated recombination protein RarA